MHTLAYLISQLFLSPLGEASTTATSGFEGLDRLQVPNRFPKRDDAAESDFLLHFHSEAFLLSLYQLTFHPKQPLFQRAAPLIVHERPAASDRPGLSI